MPCEEAQHALGEDHDGMPARHLVRVWVRVRVTVGVRVRVRGRGRGRVTVRVRVRVRVRCTLPSVSHEVRRSEPRDQSL